MTVRVNPIVRPQWTYVVPRVTREYWILVMVTMTDNPGMYGLENQRCALHRELCEHYGLTHEQTREVTDHLDRYDHNEGGGPEAVHGALQDLWDKYPLANAQGHFRPGAQRKDVK